MLKEPHKDETPKSLFNPLLEDFTVQMADDDNQPHTYVLHSKKIETFPTYIANHIEKKLAETIYLERTHSKVTKESIMPSIIREIENNP